MHSINNDPVATAEANDAEKPVTETYGLQFGNTSENLIVKGEKGADFEFLLAGLLTEYQPETHQHRAFVEQLALAHWILLRRQRTLNAHEIELYSFGTGPGNWLDRDYRRVAIIERSKTAAERSLKRALENAESLRKERIARLNHLERHEKWRAEQEFRERRLKLQEDKHAASAAKAANTAAAKARNTVPPKPPINWPPEGHIPGRKFTPQPEPAAAKPITTPDPPNRS